jgi:hypothetical protein
MKPNFALSLSFQGIALLHRAAGGWRRVGEVAIDATDLDSRLAGLRSRTLTLDPDGPRCKLIIPNDQILYMTLETGAVGGDDRLIAARAALHGATPYALEQLAFDISVDGPRTHVAAVARETLAEAEAFALEHRFDPVGFVGVPGDNAYLGEPFFGATRHAAALLGGDKVEPDGISVVVIGDVLPPAIPNPPVPPKPAPAPAPAPTRPTTPTPAAAAATLTKPAPQPRPEPPKPAPMPGFSSRRANAAPPPSELGGATREATEPPTRRLTLAPVDIDTPTAPPRPLTAARPPAANAAPGPVRPDPTAPATVAVRTDPPAKVRALLETRLGRGAAAPRPDPAPVPKPAPKTPTSPRIDELPADDESGRLTRFGARTPAAQRGKPRHLGLMLTAALLLFLAAIAAWASIFLDDGISSLWRGGGDPQTRIAVAPAPQPAISAIPAPVADPGPDRPQLASLPDPVAVPLTRDPDSAPLASDHLPPAEPAGQPQSPELSDTDNAVLDALREEAPETETAGQAPYAASDILDQAPPAPETPSIIGLDDLYVASIDRTDLSQDAIALPPAPALATDLPLRSVGSPPAADTVFDIDRRGLVVATADGALSPDGVMIYAGRPAKVPPATPNRVEPPAEADQLNERLAGLKPKPRPGNLVERAERGQLGGKSRDELARLRPKPRPAGLRAPAPVAPPPAAAPEPTPEPIPEAAPDPAAVAVAAAARPKTRPGDLPAPTGRDAAAAKAGNNSGSNNSGDEADDEPDVVASAAPSAPSTASVARQATVQNAINLNHLNLIGVYGTQANRRALIRLPSGRYKKVKVGDSVDGGKVVAIGDSELRYQKGGRSLTLKMPKG